MLFIIGLDAQILRFYNITNRYTDGVCSYEIKNNAFANLIKSYIEIGAIQKSMLSYETFFMPIDFVAEAVVSSLSYTSDCNLIQIVNSKSFTYGIFAKILRQFGIYISIISDDLMQNIASGIFAKKDMVFNILANKDNYNLQNLKENDSFSKNYLDSIGFNIPKLNKSYIIRLLNYFKSIGFIDF